jgi:DNA-binding NtrC family response regulator
MVDPVLLTMNASGSHASKPPTVFVVDDEPLLLELASLTIEPLGYTVRTFVDPETALREFNKDRPELVITDYAMGRMSGMDLIRECRIVNPEQKIILISGTVDEYVFADARVRPNRFISKPYQLSDFSSCITEVLGQK